MIEAPQSKKSTHFQERRHPIPLLTIGIIGGADGPTEILLSGKRSIWELVAGVIFAAVIIGIILFIRKKNP